MKKTAGENVGLIFQETNILPIEHFKNLILKNWKNT